MTTAVLIPAYGRDYQSVKDAEKAWASGADFELASRTNSITGKYCSVRDLPELRSEGFRFVQIRFKCLSRVAIVKIGA